MIANTLERFIHQPVPHLHAVLTEQRGTGTPRSEAVFHSPQEVPGPMLKTMNLDVIYDPQYAALEDEATINFVHGDNIADL